MVMVITCRSNPLYLCIYSATIPYIICMIIRKYFRSFIVFCTREGERSLLNRVPDTNTSVETIAFVEAQKKHDSNWIERDIVLEEIDQIARTAGFKDGLSIVPMPHPLALQTYSVDEWTHFKDGDFLQRHRFTDNLAQINYWYRVIFTVHKTE